jgi:hypothetical protein
MAEFLQGLTEAQRQDYEPIQQQLQQNTEEEGVILVPLEQIPRVPPSLEDLNYQQRLSLLKGTYFLRMEEILHNGNLESVPIEMVDEPLSFVRERVPDLNDYQTTVTQGREGGINFEISSNTSMSFASRLHTMWPCDAFGATRLNGSEVAHLIPKSREDSYEWMDVSNWALGFDFLRGGDWEQSLRLLRGVQDDSKRRLDNTGLVHSRYNRLRLKSQRSALDGKAPYVMFLPIMTIQECLDWRGGAYSAIVLVAAAPGKFIDIGLTDTAELHAVSPGTTQELRTALHLLRNCAIDMATSLQVRLPAQSDEDAVETARTRRETRYESFFNATNLDGNQSIRVPIENATVNPGDNRGICKTQFSSRQHQEEEFGDQEEDLEDQEKLEDQADQNLHPAPDPLLLVARSSVVWSVRNNWRLRTSVEPQDSDSDSSDEMLLPPSWLTNEKEPSEKRFDSVRPDPILERNFVVEF